MKSTIGIVLLFSISSVAFSGVYKCVGENGKVSYQADPCAKLERASVVRTVSSKSTGGQQSKSSSKTKPYGKWVGKKNRNFKADISKSGGFEMTDKNGAKLIGTWRVGKDGSYTVNAKFQGMSFPVNMKYEVLTDTLLLSRPALPNSFMRYQRQ